MIQGLSISAGKKKKQNSLRNLKWCGKHSKTAHISSKWRYHQAAINPARRWITTITILETVFPGWIQEHIETQLPYSHEKYPEIDHSRSSTEWVNSPSQPYSLITDHTDYNQWLHSLTNNYTSCSLPEPVSEEPSPLHRTSITYFLFCLQLQTSPVSWSASLPLHFEVSSSR